MILSRSDWGLSQIVGYTKLAVLVWKGHVILKHLKPCNSWAANFRPPHVSGESQWHHALSKGPPGVCPRSPERTGRAEGRRSIDCCGGGSLYPPVIKQGWIWLVGKSPKLNWQYGQWENHRTRWRSVAVFDYQRIAIVRSARGHELRNYSLSIG
jgi:hypothetical protein